MKANYDIDKLNPRKLYNEEWMAKLKNKADQEDEFLEKEFDFDKAVLNPYKNVGGSINEDHKEGDRCQ